jgi:hypothetical protein
MAEGHARPAALQADETKIRSSPQMGDFGRARDDRHRTPGAGASPL